MPNDLLRELGQIDNVSPSSRRATRTSSRSTASTCSPATTTCSPGDGRRRHRRHPGGLAPGRAARCAASSTSPSAGTRSRTALRDLYKALSVTTNPIPVKAALNLAGHEVGGLRLPLVEATEEEKAVIRAALERHELLAAV